MNILEIVYVVGFLDFNYFSRIYYKEMGIILIESRKQLDVNVVKLLYDILLKKVNFFLF